ncbi:hypothetical protein EDD28_0551 [Salana multivorans]|uniref:Uncharacterized protein n=1 Tax=Salana multivorans TaxID=120377 RepID=A0A3N2D872_9MICO|nr:hypothetical protein [Salana multivorans]ROR95981.1 hypothetical protein EDD28_0551 [Salana multivorans]
MTTTPETTIAVDFDLISYINSGTVARREVVIYADEQAAGELIDALAALRALGWSDDEEPRPSTPKDGPLDEPSEPAGVGLLLDRARAAQERLDASRSVWTVQALSSETADDIMAEHPLPKMPTPAKDSASERERERYQERYLAYRESVDRTQREQRYALLSRAVVSVETPHGTAEGASVEQLHAIDARPGGQKWIDRLWSALDEAQTQDPDVPRPTWLGRSTNSPA